jgi:hypothetical protein
MRVQLSPDRFGAATGDPKAVILTHVRIQSHERQRP